jgi:pimeloyl-ACP methyl ester carboxylesterase
MTRPALILLPGMLCDAVLWQPQLAALGDVAEITVGDLTRADSLAAMAEAVLERAPARFALAGLSMGGYLCFEIMRRAPGRVERLALLASSARADTEEQKQRRLDLIHLAETGSFKGLTPRLLPHWVHADRLEDRAFIATVTAMTQRVGRDAFIRQQRAVMQRPDSRPGLARIRVPTLVLCGRQDLVTPLEMAREIAADIAAARLVVVEDCGHLATLEKPDEVNRALRAWLVA